MDTQLSAAAHTFERIQRIAEQAQAYIDSPHDINGFLGQIADLSQTAARCERVMNKHP